MLKHLSAGNISKAEKYVVESTLNINTGNRKVKKFYKTMFATITYSVLDSTITDNGAEVIVNITMIDMAALVDDTSIEALLAGFSWSAADKNSFYKLILKKISDGDVQYTNTVTTAYMEKEGGKWKVNMAQSSNFADAITGGAGELIGY